MVYFICSACQETLKGKAVDGHRCGAGVSCVDCGREFAGSAHRAHNTCVTEAQKYQGSTYKAPRAKKDPQAEWLEMLGAAAAKPSRHAATLRAATDFPNVPRKLKPFINFARNSLRVHSEKGAHGCGASCAAHDQACLPRAEACVSTSSPPARAGLADLTEVFNLIAAERPTAPPNAATLREERAKKDGAAAAEPAAALLAPAEAAGEVPAPAPAASKKRARGGDAEAMEARPAEEPLLAAADGAAGDGAIPFSVGARARALLVAAGGRMKAKRLRARLAAEGVQLGAYAALEDAQARVDKRLAKLARRGELVEDGTGKFVALAGGGTGGARGDASE